MRAIVLRKYGSLDQFEEMNLAMPEPGRNQVRVRVHASALNPADHKVALGTMKFLHARNFPMVLGYDFSGVIHAVGDADGGAVGEGAGGGVVSEASWKVGDEVFGFLPYTMSNRRGAFAEFLIADANEIALKPPTVSHAQAAAAATPGLTALQSIRNVGKLKGPGGRVLVTGISGGVGSIAISVAQRLGASVVGVGSGRGLELAKQHGVEAALDRKHPSWFDEVQGLFDVVFDAAAASSWSQWRGKLKPGGKYVTTLPSLRAFTDQVKSLFAPSGCGFVIVKSKKDDLQLLASWLATGMTVQVESTLPVRDVSKGLARLHRGEVLGRLGVDVLNGF